MLSSASLGMICHFLCAIARIKNANWEISHQPLQTTFHDLLLNMFYKSTSEPAYDCLTVQIFLPLRLLPAAIPNAYQQNSTLPARGNQYLAL
jgi:hypothetical protein